MSSREKIMKDALISPQTLTTEWSSTSEQAETHPSDGWMPRMPISKRNFVFLVSFSLP